MRLDYLSASPAERSAYIDALSETLAPDYEAVRRNSRVWRPDRSFARVLPAQMARAARRFLAAHDSDPDDERGAALESTHRHLEAASRHPIRVRCRRCGAQVRCIGSPTRQPSAAVAQRWMARVFSESGGDGLLFLMRLREDVLRRLSEEPRGTVGHRHLRALDATMADTMAQWFVSGVLELHRITFASPGLLLERVRTAARAQPALLRPAR